jgi:hypothetical protein
MSWTSSLTVVGQGSDLLRSVRRLPRDDTTNTTARLIDITRSTRDQMHMAVHDRLALARSSSERSKQFAARGIGSTKKRPCRSGAKRYKCRAWGPTCNKPHPFTFAGQHVRIGAAAGRFWDITLSGMTSLCADRGRAQPRPACRPHSRRVGALTVR